ncbi:MAG: M23 family peptidase [Leptolyngbyaceae cyanobacterium]
MRKFIRRLGHLALCAVVIVILASVPSGAVLPPEPAIPTTAIAQDNQYVRIPDWSRITFHSLPPILSDGIFESPPNINQALGYDLSRIWNAGQTAEKYLKLGDFQTSLYLQMFNLETISQITQLDLDQVALGAFHTLSWQTIDDLVTTIPGLGNFPVGEVPAIASLLGDQFTAFSELNVSSTITEVLRTFPDLGLRNLGELGDIINQFNLTSIPGLEYVPLQNFQNWGNSLIQDIPGLANVPFAQMPNPIETVGAVGIVDVVYGSAERDRSRTVSGSHQAGFSVPCQTECAYAELTGNPTTHGKQWISGQYQQVKGGFGVLGAVNGGQEPTGRHPFGNLFKVSIWDVDETTGHFSTALHFRICHRGIPDLGCTPYFLGPVPFLNHRETEPIFLGIMDGVGRSSPPTSMPTNVAAQATEAGIPPPAVPTSISHLPGMFPCGTGSGNVDFDALATAFSNIEGHYHSAGSFVCDGQGNCGRGLGRYQYMSYRRDVRQAIYQQAGGMDFLAKLDVGDPISSAEIERFFPASVQDQLFQADQSRNIEQAMTEGFSGQRLIERVGQLHFGGSGAPIDGDATDIHQQLTLKSYGEKLRQNYEGSLSQVCIGAG